MTLAVWFWLFFVLSLLLGGWGSYLDPSVAYARYGRVGGFVLLLVCLFLLGVAEFGSPIKGG